MTSSTLSLIATLARDEAALGGQEFLAPLVHGGRARLRLRGLICELTVEEARAGWWLCRAHNFRHAEIVGEALPWQRGDYLALWPQLRLVLLEPLQHGDWLALPYNASDAAQRFGLAGPVVVRLVESGQPFERIVGRVEGHTVWYDTPDRRADPAMAEVLRTALAEVRDVRECAGLGEGERAAYVLLSSRHADQRTDRQLRAALAIGGATLIGYELAGTMLRVTWERAGQRSITLLTPQLAVVSAGICLSGQDGRFDLASIVGVVRDAPGFARYGEEDI
jgi:hypothetical protein